MISKKSVIIFSILFLVYGCAANKPTIPVDQASSKPGGQVTFRGNSLNLLGSPLSVG